MNVSPVIALKGLKLVNRPLCQLFGAIILKLLPTKVAGKSNLRGKEFILAPSLRVQSIRAGRPGGRSLWQVVMPVGCQEARCWYSGPILCL